MASSSECCQDHIPLGPIYRFFIGDFTASYHFKVYFDIIFTVKARRERSGMRAPIRGHSRLALQL
jgi:hypothetical protein